MRCNVAKHVNTLVEMTSVKKTHMTEVLQASARVQLLGSSDELMQ